MAMNEQEKTVVTEDNDPVSIDPSIETETVPAPEIKPEVKPEPEIKPEPDVKPEPAVKPELEKKTDNTDNYAYTGSFEREDYADAHYEPANESTVPPRYYMPPEKPVKEPKQKKPGTGKHIVPIICALLIAALLGGMVGSAMTGSRMNRRIAALETGLAELAETEKAAQENTPAEITLPAAAASAADPAGMSPAEIYEQAKRQVVGIRTEITMTNFFGMTSSGAVSGSGFIISEDGYIMTNFHVVEEAYDNKLDIQVMTYDGTEYTAAIVGVEAANDVAILKIEAEGLNAAKIGNSDALQVGDTVYAVGNPLGELEFSMSTGHVSALGRVISTQESESINMFQIDAAVNEGNSGGPVYNSNGEVVGIVTAKYSSSGVEGLGFAIPINDANSIASDLITKGYVSGKAYMGISYNPQYNSMYAQYYGMPLGVYIQAVTKDSAADKAGLQTGDIITAIGEYTVEDYNDLKKALRQFSAFETAELTVYRAGEELHLPITFDEAKPQ